MCAIPFPKPGEKTVFSESLESLYLKLAIFYIPYVSNNVSDNRNSSNCVYWQNQYLSDCIIKDLPFDPKKESNTRNKAKITQLQDKDRAYNLLDRIKVRINNFNHLFFKLHSASGLFDMILKLII